MGNEDTSLAGGQPQEPQEQPVQPETGTPEPAGFPGQPRPPTLVPERGALAEQPIEPRLQALMPEPGELAEQPRPPAPVPERGALAEQPFQPGPQTAEQDAAESEEE